MSVEWNALSEEAKKPYLDETEELKKRYAAEMKVYREMKVHREMKVYREM